MDAKEIGNRLKKLRGIKPRRLVAHETGISYSGLSNYETGLRVPTDDHKIVLAKYYGVSIEELFFADNNHLK